MADFHVFADSEDLSHAAARLFVELSHKALGLRGRFIVALSGCSTPKRLFEILAESPAREAVPWDRTLVFWGDDRVVPPDHEWSNYKLAHDALFAHVPLPDENIMRIRGELGPEDAAEDMRRNMVNVFGDQGLPRFDLAVLGVGDDGHTASLFPGTAARTDDWVMPVLDPPADPRIDRITLTLPVLNEARLALFLVAGEGKRNLIGEIMNNPAAGERYPAANVEAEETIWYMDEAAFGGTK